MRFTVERTSVESSNIAAVGYDLHSQRLEVEFTGRGGAAGSVYQYVAVPPELYERFMNSPSKGGFFAREIKGKFSAVRVQ